MIGPTIVLVYLLALAPQTGGDSAKNEVEDRLTRSVAALRSFGENASDVTRKLFDAAVCIGVAPRRAPDEGSAGMRGFLSCRPGAQKRWSAPAAILIEGGGVYWPVIGEDSDIVLLATNRVTATFLETAEIMFSSGVDSLPGPVRQDQIPLLSLHPEVFVYRNSDRGLAGIQIAGATMREDMAVNTAVYGKALHNAAILKGSAAGQTRIAVDRFLAALPSALAEVTAKVAAVAAVP